MRGSLSDTTFGDFGPADSRGMSRAYTHQTMTPTNTTAMTAVRAQLRPRGRWTVLRAMAMACLRLPLYTPGTPVGLVPVRLSGPFSCDRNQESESVQGRAFCC